MYRLTILFFLLLAVKSRAQLIPGHSNNLNRNISVRFINQPLKLVLDKISKEGNFYFSYSGSTFHSDSLISLNVQNKPIRNVLDILFKGEVDYKESGNYIILRTAIYRFNVEAGDVRPDKNSYEIEGYVYNQRTGEGVKNASVYEKKQLKSTLTDNKGYFKLKFKGDHQGLVISVSKEDFRDTSIQFLAGVTITEQGYAVGSGGEGAFSNRVERYGLSRWLVSSRQRIQSLNIPSFIANSPFQASLLPGLSSHGMLSSQIVNMGSLNVIGGYTAGVDGAEFAGIFNINKQDAKKFQAAGVMNIVGGRVEGFQSAGIFNIVLDSVIGGQFAGVFNNVERDVHGVQGAGVINRARGKFIGGQFGGVANLTQGKFSGIQAAGVINITANDVTGSQYAGVTNINAGKLKGVQGAGVLNLNWKPVEGTQFAGILNIAGNRMKGVQVAGVLNFAKKMNGTQVGLVNVADTSSGYSIGLLNLVRKGYHKISISSSDVMKGSINLKTGNNKLYTMLGGGVLSENSKNVYSAGLGLGHDFIYNNKLSLALEVHSQYIFLKNTNFNNLSRLQTNLQYQIIKGFTVFAGPGFSVYNVDSAEPDAYQKSFIPSHAKNLFKGDQKGWFGWQAGVTFM
ncbi:STN and carboxypeptidase regulatory-like domain-containing protein [Desertivirga arenae]|uniref:STN and carboxypeptidase regulatory-like domain-containing protein n=1 Tax=Desertivirga arenae TaxID=2810309 RepID=UPI001A95CB38|nr:STN and carboxypeptidase regulatory-like domain-containing protein [Pedobacter sp. SYSU D00823]